MLVGLVQISAGITVSLFDRAVILFPTGGIAQIVEDFLQLRTTVFQ